MALSRHDIEAAALDLLDAEGLDGFSMRTLAGRLGVRPSALYWHLGGKTELVSLMAQNFYLRAFAAAAEAAGWRGWLLAFGHAFRRALLAHRDSARLCASAAPSQPDAESNAEALAAPLVERGLERAVALSYQASVISLALGWSIFEQSNALHDHLAAMIGFDESFALGLKAMVAGFDGTHERTS